MQPAPDHPLRILVIAPQPFFQERGTPIAVRLLVEELVGLGHQVDLLVYHEGEDIEIQGATIHRSSYASHLSNIPPGFSWKKVLCDFRIYSKARALISVQGYDVLHCVEESVFMAMRFKKKYGIPYVYDMDSSLSIQLIDKIPALKIVRPLIEGFEKRAVAGSSGIVAVCPALVDQARLYSPDGHITCLADINLQEEIGEGDEDLRQTLQTDKPLLMYVGNLERYQGMELLLDSIQELKERGVPVHLAVIGGSEKDIGHYRERAAQLLIDSLVSFCGPRDLALLGYYLNQADILVSPRTQGNNTPMKIYSYLGSGKPVLATALPTHTQVLTDEVACLCKPDSQSLADGLQYLLEHPEEGEMLGRKGKQLVDDNYSRPAYRKKLEDFCQKLSEIISRPTK